MMYFHNAIAAKLQQRRAIEDGNKYEADRLEELFEFCCRRHAEANGLAEDDVQSIAFRQFAQHQ